MTTAERDELEAIRLQLESVPLTPTVFGKTCKGGGGTLIGLYRGEQEEAEINWHETPARLGNTGLTCRYQLERVPDVFRQVVFSAVPLMAQVTLYEERGDGGHAYQDYVIRWEGKQVIFEKRALHVITPPPPPPPWDSRRRPKT